MNKRCVNIGGTLIGDGHPAVVVAEIGINHNGDIVLAKRLIDSAVEAGCWAVKFQKRTISAVYPAGELAKARTVPKELLGNAVRRGVLPEESVRRLLESKYENTTNGDLKYALEFSREEYMEIDRYCREKGIIWFASPWDEDSVDFLEQFNPFCYKVASASLTDDGLLCHIRSQGKPVIISTGMSTIDQVDHAVGVLGSERLVVLHCNSTYPSRLEELNLRAIQTLKDRYGVPVGYSGHEVGLAPSVASVALGACMVERHITLDRSMWGSDQAASVEPQGFERMLKDIRAVEASLGDGRKVLYESEVAVRDKLRRK